MTARDRVERERLQVRCRCGRLAGTRGDVFSIDVILSDLDIDTDHDFDLNLDFDLDFDLAIDRLLCG